MNKSKRNRSAPVEIAWKTLDSFVRFGKIPAAENASESNDSGLSGRAGCFVSLKKKGELRGCIGTIAPTTNGIEEEIIRNAVAACSEDPRFDPVETSELEDLTVSVDILGSPEAVSSRTELDPSCYGVIVTAGFRRGLLLPDLEGVDTVEKQLAIACGKGGIDPAGMYQIQRFSVTRYY